jgi:hypothetical protein
MGRTRLERLEALRQLHEDTIANGVPARELAALSREYRLTMAEIAELNPEKATGDGIDEISERRASRRSGSAASPSRAHRPG